MTPDDPWDWPFLLYVGTVILRRPEKSFWTMTPKKLTALAKVHGDMNGAKDKDEEPDKPKVAFIDQVL